MVTVGHGTRQFKEFVDLLSVGEVETVVDVRTLPRSWTNPQFNAAVMTKSLKPYGIDYLAIPELGGLRGRSKDVPPQINGFWQNRSFHNYADYALSKDFREGMRKLIKLQKQCAIMCSESVWWRCHRRIIADYLIAQGKDVFHLMNKDQIEPAFLTPGALVVNRWRVEYSALIF